nr:hypothetical protein CFP56_48734 [Quercus suber]
MPSASGGENSIRDKLRKRFRYPFHVNSTSDGNPGHVFWRSPIRPRPDTDTSIPIRGRRQIGGCCVEERERWREQQRTRGCISCVSEPAQADRSSSAAIRSESTRCTKAMTFLDLPPEIRVMVYEHYFTARAQSPERLTPFTLPALNASNTYPPGSYYKPVPPYDPPLCLASRELRHETRPVFFRTHRFPIPIHLEPPTPSSPSSNPYTPVTWYRRLDPMLLRLIRHLEIHFCFEKADRVLNNLRAPDALLLEVDLHEQADAFTIVRSRHVATGPHGRGLVDLVKLEGHVCEVLTEVLRNRGVTELEWRDYEALAPEWK